jgi:hypothetical protein
MASEIKNRHVSALIDLLSKQHEASLEASGGDADAAFAGDPERIGLASRVLSGIVNGTAAEDIELEGTKQQAEIHSTGGRPVKDAGAPNDPTRSVYGQDSRSVGPSHPLFGTGDGPRARVDSRFGIDGVFSVGSEGAGSQLDHSLASVFKPAPVKLANG